MSMAGNLANRVYSNKGNPAVLAAVPCGVRSLLDVGCGAGDNVGRLAEQGILVDGITISPAEAEQAKQYCRTVLVWDLEQGLPLGLKDTYDVVVASHVLEHLVNPGALLSGLRSKLAAGHGKLVVALPNLMHCKYRWHLICGRFEYEPTGIMDSTHVCWYTLKSAQTLLTGHGYVVERAFAEGFVPQGPLRRLLPGSWGRGIDRLGAGWFPGFFGRQLLILPTAK